MSVQDMTLNKSDGGAPAMLELWVPLHFHHSQAHSGPEWAAPDRVLSMGGIELFDI